MTPYKKVRFFSLKLLNETACFKLHLQLQVSNFVCIAGYAHMQY